MNSQTCVCACLSALLLPAPLLAGPIEDEAITIVQVLREGGCGGIVPAAQPLHRDSALDRAAQQWAGGAAPATAAQADGYPADTLSAVHVTEVDALQAPLLKRTQCLNLADRRLHDMGVYHRGRETWLIVASRVVTPATTSSLGVRTLQLVNDIRARGTRCGERSFGPAPPVRLSGTLNDVALGHAIDMARHDYFEHQDLSGRSPAQRVRAVGYAEKLVGENIAYGPGSAEEVVKGWLDSPGHCENIMDPRFAEMGIASAPGLASHRGLYWVQLLTAPKV